MPVGSLVIEYLVKDSTSMNLGLCYELFLQFSFIVYHVICIMLDNPLVLFETTVFDALPNFCFLTCFNLHSLDIFFSILLGFMIVRTFNMASSSSSCFFVIHISVFVLKHVSYLLLKEMPSYTFGEASTFGGAGMGKAVGGEMTGPPMADHSMRASPGAMSSDLLTYGRNMNLINQLPVDAMPRRGRETVPLPLDASSTLYVEGLPPDSTMREVAHIFRHFVGYKAVRLVNEESGLSIMQRGGDPLILCFVDFENPTHAATALSALQGHCLFLFINLGDYQCQRKLNSSFCFYLSL
ncbi:uncharacterized protein LOC126586197 isoform X2 [Malus sylvestris]|uniref:uncharacterized protein LOC126586197 isoform X2 n=1 Tax=Malus sylvestris TaxID=3752 RepID=UPI0021ABB420|nr:uncharacterized protein LOC126586197 isoform X2 [Malus sylvestris]